VGNSLREVYEKLEAFLIGFARTCKTVLEGLMKFFRENWKIIKDKAIELLISKEDMKIAKRNHHKFNFSQLKVRHQVIERKPRHLIRKVIQ
jgi:hypothetical protein